MNINEVFTFNSQSQICVYAFFQFVVFNKTT